MSRLNTLDIWARQATMQRQSTGPSLRPPHNLLASLWMGVHSLRLNGIGRSKLRDGRQSTMTSMSAKSLRKLPPVMPIPYLVTTLAYLSRRDGHGTLNGGSRRLLKMIGEQESRAGRGKFTEKSTARDVFAIWSR